MCKEDGDVDEVRTRLNFRLNGILNDIRCQTETQEIDNERLDYISLQLEQLQCLVACGFLPHEIILLVEHGKEQLELSKRRGEHNSYQAPCEGTGDKGIPGLLFPWSNYSTSLTTVLQPLTF